LKPHHPFDPDPFDLAADLSLYEAQRLRRTRQIVEGPQGPEVYLEGHRYLSFCSNDYLGLAAEPRVREALKQAVDRYGVGSGASHLITGHSLPHHALEEILAEFTGRPRALLFSTGYMANVGTISALLQRGDWVFEDRLNHASLLDGALLSRAQLRRYPHADADRLEQDLRGAASARRRLVVSDGVFSMDGDGAPVPALAGVAQRQGAWLMIDDAHGLGVLGATGAGTLEHYRLGIAEVPVLVGTLGKALGTFGAFVAGSEALIETLIQRARSYVYTTALPPAIAQATCTSLRILREEGWRREHLGALVAYFRQGAEQLGLPLLSSETPIQPLLVGEAEEALRLSAALRGHGALVHAVRPPTVPRGTARLRITLSAAHTQAQVDQLLGALAASFSPVPPASPHSSMGPLQEGHAGSTAGPVTRFSP
jgi:8-amino-7-oxononanoate synthase